jgi:hypothetical protein
MKNQRGSLRWPTWGVGVPRPWSTLPSTPALPYVRIVLLPEIPDGREDGIGCGLAEATERAVFDSFPNCLQQFHMIPTRLTGSDSRSSLDYSGIRRQILHGAGYEGQPRRY